MKLSPIWALWVPVSALIFSSCKKEEVAEVVETVEQAVDEVVSGGAAASAEERAAKLGFVGHLSSDTESVMALYDGKGMVSNLRSLDLWTYLLEVIEEEEGMNPEEEIAEQAEMVGEFLGNEMFIATGKGTSTQMESLQVLNSRMGYYQMRVLSGALAEGLVSGDPMEALGALDDETAWLMDLAEDIGDYMPLIEGAEVPPVLAGLKITDADTMEMADVQIEQMLAQVPPDLAESIEFEKGGAKFNGFLFKGEMLAEEMEGDRDEVDEVIGKENTDKIIATMKEKTLVVAIGKLGDYLLLYAGSNAEGCPIADDLASSLASNDAISYVDAHLGNPVHGFLFGEKGLMEAMNVGGFKDLADGIRDGFAGVEGFSGSRELTALLDMVGEREKALMDLVEVDTFGGLITVDGGARFDLFGGLDGKNVDSSAAHNLAGLGEGDHVLVFGNWVTGEEYQKRVSELLKVVVESAYEITGKVMETEMEDDDLAQFQAQFQMFDQLFRNDFVSLYDGLSTMGEGLGNESALVVDLNAAVPPFPGVPQELVEGGRFIRASYVAPVTDRSKLGEAWKSVDASVRSMLKSAKELGAGDINMLVPTSSEKNDLVTWYFDAVAFSDDVKPSVTINDEWFVASTSRTQALDLVARAGSEGGVERKGAWFEFNMDALREYADETVNLLDENSEVILGDAAADFSEELPRIRKGLKALGQIGAITIHDREESGHRRISLHFQTR